MVLADPEGNPFCVMEPRDAYVDTGPIAAIRLDSADPSNDQDFWAWLTGWSHVLGPVAITLPHPSRRGPLLELYPESSRKCSVKNQLHPDIRLDSDDNADDVAAGIAERGGRELSPACGELPWRVYADPSGNEFCVLPSRS